MPGLSFGFMGQAQTTQRGGGWSTWAQLSLPVGLTHPQPPPVLWGCQKGPFLPSQGTLWAWRACPAGLTLSLFVEQGVSRGHPAATLPAAPSAAPGGGEPRPGLGTQSSRWGRDARAHSHRQEPAALLPFRLKAVCMFSSQEVATQGTYSEDPRMGSGDTHGSSGAAQATRLPGISSCVGENSLLSPRSGGTWGPTRLPPQGMTEPAWDCGAPQGSVVSRPAGL